MKVLLFYILFFLIPAINFAIEPKCEGQFRSVAESSSSTTEVTDQVEILWYPEAGYEVVSHAELAVGGTVWNTLTGYNEKTTIDAVEKAAKTGRRGVFRFKLAVTPREYESLQKFLKDREGMFAAQMCIGGACRAIKANTGIIIPFPFSSVPTLAALYLTLVHKLGYKRVVKIEFTGKSAIKNLIGLEVPCELWVTKQAVTFLIVSVMNAAGKIVQLMVPVESKSDDDDEESVQENDSLNSFSSPEISQSN